MLIHFEALHHNIQASLGKPIQCYHIDRVKLLDYE